MPIVQGSEPRERQKRGGGAWLGWLVPLLIFGPTLYRALRNTVAGRLTDQQLLIAAAGVVLLVTVIVLVQRVNRSRSSASLPTTYQAPRKVPVPPPVTQPPGSESYAPQPLSSDTYVTRAPRFEPIITGKVALAGIVLAAVFAGIGFLVLQGL